MLRHLIRPLLLLSAMALAATVRGENLQLLHSFSGPDGTWPSGSLVQAGDGNFYGATVTGGNYQYGTVFRMSPVGNITTLYHFDGTNGASPHGGLVLASDNYLYGTTMSGPSTNTIGWGTIFKISTTGEFTNLFQFSGTNGYQPFGQLIQGSDGAIYGTTYGGGTNYDPGCNCGGGPGDNGTIFRFTTNGTFTCLASLNGTNGSVPWGGLAESTNGVFYGTTQIGGPDDAGTIFSITTNGVITNLHFFDFDHWHPQYALLAARDNCFYGVTGSGGYPTIGNAFRVTGTDFAYIAEFDTSIGMPGSALVEDANGNLYGFA